MIYFLILVSYAAVIMLYSRGFRKYPSFHSTLAEGKSNYSFSILIPFRNPSENFAGLLAQIQSQLAHLPETELILIDDFSVGTLDSSILKGRIQLLYLKDYSPELSAQTHNKKQAIELGVAQAKGDYILCLDADVEIPEKWLREVTAYIDQHSPKFLAGIHRYTQNASVLGRFLHLEQDVLTAISIGSLQMGYPTMCNGANMAFEKKAFSEVGGYDGLHAVAGGDDLFLYHRMYSQYSHGVQYLKSLDSAVYSEPPHSIPELLNQRNRWLGKSFSYENSWVLPQMILIFLANLIALGAYIFIFIFPWQCLCILALKWMTDYVLIRNLSGFFERRHSVEDVLFVLLYPIYAVMIPCMAAWRMIVSMISSHD